MTGVVKSISDRGFCFIRGDGEHVDYFAHRSSCADFDGYATGQRVEFEVVHNDKGPRADFVRPLN